MHDRKRDDMQDNKKIEIDALDQRISLIQSSIKTIRSYPNHPNILLLSFIKQDIRMVRIKHSAYVVN